MKKKFLFLMALLAVSLLALAEMTIYVYKKDGTKVPYVAAEVDSVGFLDVNTITFNANGGKGSMEMLRVNKNKSVILPSNLFKVVNAEFVGWNTSADGFGTSYSDKATITLSTSITLYAQWNEFTIGNNNNHEWVDLGLPSGTLWATMNVGADSPEEAGYYFAWGETEFKGSYTWCTYKWSLANYDEITKYCTMSNYGSVDNKIVLELLDDAAHVNWGGDWRMPTKSECDELCNSSYTNWDFIILNGEGGFQVTSKINGNSIFLPAAGYAKEEDENKGYYWSSSLCETSDWAYAIHFYPGNYNLGSWGDAISPAWYCGGGERQRGYSVRPVLSK